VAKSKFCDNATSATGHTTRLDLYSGSADRPPGLYVGLRVRVQREPVDSH